MRRTYEGIHQDIPVDGAGSPCKAHTEVIVWEDEIVKNVLPIPRLADLSTKMRRIVNFESVDDHLSYHKFLNHYRTCHVPIPESLANLPPTVTEHLDFFRHYHGRSSINSMAKAMDACMSNASEESVFKLAVVSLATLGTSRLHDG
jgi:hypothetical protein